MDATYETPPHLNGNSWIGTSVDFTNVVEKQLFADALDRRDFSREGYRHGGHPITGLGL